LYQEVCKRRSVGSVGEVRRKKRRREGGTRGRGTNDGLVGERVDDLLDVEVESTIFGFLEELAGS